MARRALVTGSAGFVGRHVAGRLVRDGWDVLGTDIVASPPDGTWPFLAGPLGDVRRIATFDRPYDLVVHCAAVVGGRRTIEQDPLAVAVNFELDAAIFRWAVKAQPGRIIYYSSSAAYPIALQMGDDAMRLREGYIASRIAFGEPDATYGWAKLTGEMLAGHARAAGVPVTVIRPFSGYGADQSLDYPFPAYIDRARRRADPFDVWGDGQQTRDFVHIDDVVELTMRCVEQGIDGPVNACTGRATSFNQLAVLVAGMAGYAPQIRHLPAEPTGVMHRVGDPTRMREILPDVLRLEAGVERALEGR